ncbi:hypothetical protein BC629DRAFT_858131 [Irpex lacteus]|nr:hypothetical protein BC629DRAFT_858131 [Irpex lacteus]
MVEHSNPFPIPQLEWSLSTRRDGSGRTAFRSDFPYEAVSTILVPRHHRTLLASEADHNAARSDNACVNTFFNTTCPRAPRLRLHLGLCGLDCLYPEYAYTRCVRMSYCQDRLRYISLVMRTSRITHAMPTCMREVRGSNQPVQLLHFAVHLTASVPLTQCPLIHTQPRSNRSQKTLVSSRAARP